MIAAFSAWKEVYFPFSPASTLWGIHVLMLMPERKESTPLSMLKRRQSFSARRKEFPLKALIFTPQSFLAKIAPGPLWLPGFVPCSLKKDTRLWMHKKFFKLPESKLFKYQKTPESA